jgi:hypothetical protein
MRQTESQAPSFQFLPDLLLFPVAAPKRHVTEITETVACTVR